MDDKIEIKDLTQGEPTVTDWLIYQSADDDETYKAPKSDIEGENAYVYVAYADDEDGNGFTNTFNESKDYIAVKSTNTEIPAPVASDFAGLWKNYKGAKGDDGDAATATAGTTTTLAAGQSAKVTNVGTTSAAVFKFEIPKGDKGDDGAKIVTAEFVGNDIHFNLDDGTEAILVGAKTDLKGATGNTGASVVDAEVSGDDIVFTKSDGSTITIENILIELKGETGNGIATIEKTDTTGLVDTYTITYDDETTKDFTVTNGAKGDKGDAATIAVGETTTGDAGTEASVENVGTSSNAIFNFTIPKGDKGTGITSIEKTGTSDLTDTYTITFSDETTTTFDVVNGEKGDNAYIYIAYASDDSGTDFTTTFNSALDYIAVLSSYVEIPTPQASDFAGLWKKYKGEKGDTGERGLNWTNEEYSGAITYNVDDALFYNGSSYRCILESTGHIPTDTTYWSLVAQKGVDGSGDMLASVYDPTNIAGDAFDMDNMVEGTNNKLVSGTEKSNWNNKLSNIKNESIEDLKDVSITTKADGDVLSYNSTSQKWEAKVPAVSLEKASGSDVNSGSDDAKYVTSKALADSKFKQNPMTDKGDIIYGETSGTPTKLAKGTDGQVLKLASGVPVWSAEQDISGKMSNPMTTAGDIIIGGTSGTPTRLAKGANDKVLKMKSGSLSWENDENTTYTASDFDIKDLSDTNNKKAGWDNKQDKIQAVTKEIKTTDWSNKEVTVSVAGITASSIIWVSPERDSFDDYTDAGILGVSQGTDEIAFVCEEEPGSDIEVIIAFA